MTNHRLSKPVIAFRKSLRVLLIFSGVMAMAFFLGLEILRERKDNLALENVRIRSEDLRISITWDAAPFSRVREVEIAVKGEDFNQLVSVPAGQGEWSFREGEFGKLYTIVVRGVDPGGICGEETIATRLFLDEGRLPDLPLI